MAPNVESTEHASRARAREDQSAHEGAAISKCGCWVDAAGTEVLCPHHSRFEADGTPRELGATPAGDSKDTTEEQLDRTATLLAAMAGDPRPFVAAFDYELNSSGMTGRKRAFLYTLIRVMHKGKAYAYAGVAPSTVSAWRKADQRFSELEKLAEALHLEALEAELDRRAFEGVNKPVFGKLEGKEAGNGIIGYVREYSDQLLMFRLKAIAPEKYREKGEKEGSNRNAPDVAALRTDLAAKLKRAAEAKRLPASSEVDTET